MPVEEVTMFKTTKGTVHATREGAEAGQLQENFEAEVNALVEGVSYHENRELVRDFIEEKASQLLNILKRRFE